MKNVTKKLRDQFIVEMLYGQKSISRIAKNLNLSHNELAQLTQQPEIQKILKTLSTFVEMYANMLLYRQRLAAISRLGMLVRQRKDHELSRKACVDLIKMTPTNLNDRSNKSADETDLNDTAGISDEALHSFITSMGGDSDATSDQ